MVTVLRSERPLLRGLLAPPLSATLNPETHKLFRVAEIDVPKRYQT
jgi:hypothetical protein